MQLSDSLQALQADLLARLWESTAVKEPSARAISDAALLAALEKAYDSNDPLNGLWQIANELTTTNPVAAAWVQDILQDFIRERPALVPEPKVMRASLLAQAQDQLNAVEPGSAAHKRAELRLLCSQIELQLRDSYSFGETWTKLEAVLDSDEIDFNLELLSGEEIGALLANGLQLVRRLGTTEQIRRFLSFTEHYLTQHLATIPPLFRVQIATRLAALNGDFGDATLDRLTEASQSLQETGALDEGARQDLKDNDQELALMECLALVPGPLAADSLSYKTAKADFRKRFGLKSSPRFVESWAHLLLEEGLARGKREPIQEAFDVLQGPGQHEFLRAAAQIRVVDQWPEFFTSAEARQEAILDAWRPIEHSLGFCIMALMSRCLDLGDAGVQIEAVLTSGEGEPDFLPGAVLFLDQMPAVPPLLTQLFRSIIKHFGNDLKRIQTPLDYIRESTKAAFLSLCQRREKKLFAEQAVEGDLRQVLDLESMSVRDRQPGDPFQMQSSYFLLEPQIGEGLPEAMAQEVVIPLDETQVAVLRKPGLPLLTDSDLYWAAKFLRQQHANDASRLFSGENAWEAMVRPVPHFEVLTPEAMQSRYLDNDPWLQAFDEVHFKEAKVDLIPDDDIFWVVVTDKYTGLPLGFQSINKVDIDNYAFTLEGLRDLGSEACVAHLREFFGEPGLELEHLVEITNMGIMFRYLKAETMAYLFSYTAQTILDKKQYYYWVIVTIQSMLQRGYKSLELDFRILTEAEALSREEVDGRIQRNPKLGLVREPLWTGRGSKGEIKTRGGAISMPSALKSKPIRQAVENFEMFKG